MRAVFDRLDPALLKWHLAGPFNYSTSRYAAYTAAVVLIVVELCFTGFSPCLSMYLRTSLSAVQSLSKRISVSTFQSVYQR